MRARLKSGRWIGGYYGEDSCTSSYPEAADLYPQAAWALSATGLFERPLEHSGGIYIRMDDVECLDFIEVPPVTADGEATSDRNTTAVGPQREEGLQARGQTAGADPGSAHASCDH
ncbi:putative membrane protein [Streptomyces azureus]|uniref:Putative membrane protein n=1 Tax=Streptomyces azureus TaxID=146537 RepID=A0A0K8PKG3_STRAJ|nr:putative membrane protein [Streptomyces azureus]